MEEDVHATLDAANTAIADWIKGRSVGAAGFLSHPILAFILIAILATLLTLRLVRGRERVAASVSETPPPPEKELLWPPSRLEVVKFFLNLYRKQLAPSREPVETKLGQRDHQYRAKTEPERQ